MNASNFDESNAVLGPPKGVSEDDVRSLNVYRDGKIVVSCWKPNLSEVEEIVRTGRIWLVVMGSTMPPVLVSGFSPFGHDKEKT